MGLCGRMPVLWMEMHAMNPTLADFPPALNKLPVVLLLHR